MIPPSASDATSRGESAVSAPSPYSATAAWTVVAKRTVSVRRKRQPLIISAVSDDGTGSAAATGSLTMPPVPESPRAAGSKPLHVAPKLPPAGSKPSAASSKPSGVSTKPSAAGSRERPRANAGPLVAPLFAPPLFVPPFPAARASGGITIEATSAADAR